MLFKLLKICLYTIPFTVLFAQEFEFSIEVSDGNFNQTLIIGVNPAGTDNFDTDLDMQAPPPPPTGAFDARLTYLNVDYFKDIRDNSNSQKEFFLLYAPGPDGSITLSWDSSLVRDLGNFEIVDNVTGELFNFDMLSGDFLDVSTHTELQDGLKILVTPFLPSAINDESSNKDNLPKKIILYQNYPNPFNPGTMITYALPQTSRVHLAVYNVVGEVVSVIVNKVQEEGFHEIDLDVSNLPSGIYYYRITADSFVETKKMILIK